MVAFVPKRLLQYVIRNYRMYVFKDDEVRKYGMRYTRISKLEYIQEPEKTSRGYDIEVIGRRRRAVAGEM